MTYGPSGAESIKAMTGNDLPWIILKFGGTSVAEADRWQTIARIVRERLDEGVCVLVVCSALRGVSDALDALVEAALAGEHAERLQALQRRHLDLAAALGVDGPALLAPHFERLQQLLTGIALLGEASPRIRARVMARGELMSSTLGAAYLARQGLDVGWQDARDLLRARETPAHWPATRRFLSATCDASPDPALRERLARTGARVVVTQGFIARDAGGRTVLLGRGGSDTSAAYFAARLQARRLEIWTDVPGLFTANPHEVPTARLIERIGYDEAQELATTGARVLHPACIDPVRRHRIPLHLRSTLAPELPGTVVTADPGDHGPHVKAIAVKQGVVLVAMETLGMWQQVGFLADVFAVFKRHGVSVDLVATSESNVTVSLDPAANTLAPEALHALVEDLAAYCTPRLILPCAVISLVGRHIRSILHRLGPIFEAFDAHHLYLLSQAASDLNLSFVVDEAQAIPLARRLHARLFEADAGTSRPALNGTATGVASGQHA
ncbi:aspartate kinase [Rhodocaloribacter litoris]|uniref:aspartate kinase n=1 Tax=Rhodocaloribacter litoris TaxID=2558931 RepID=UPI001E518AB4|nr:aspartate kinase [Rhodocaloribacter litoris]